MLGGRFIFWGLCAVLVFLPLAFGSVEEWAVYVFEAAVFVLFGVHAAMRWRSSKERRKSGVRKKGAESIDSGENKQSEERSAQERSAKRQEWSARGEKGERREAENAGIPRWLTLLLVVFLVVALFQLVPLPQTVLKAVSPSTYGLYQGLSFASLDEGGLNKRGLDEEGLDEGRKEERSGEVAGAEWTGAGAWASGKSWKTISLSPCLSRYELVKYIFIFLFGYLVMAYVRGKKRIETFVLVLILCGVFQAFYGLIEFFGGTHGIFGWKNIYYSDSTTGTFINRNHFAGFLAMLFPLSVGYLLTKAQFFSMKKGLSFKERVLWFSQERLQKSVIAGMASVLIGLGIFFSRSRMGITAFLLSTAAMVLILAAPGKGREEKSTRGRRFGRIIRFVLLVVVFAAVLIGIKPVIERFSWSALESEIRPVLFRNTVDMIESYPLFGTGLGTFVYAYPGFEKAHIPQVVDHAHNDYLEIAAESGIVGGLSLAVFAFGFFGWLLVRWLGRRDYFVKGVVLGCLMGVLAILLHSLIDFNLHITANAVYFVALYALAFRAVLLNRNASSESTKTQLPFGSYLRSR